MFFGPETHSVVAEVFPNDKVEVGHAHAEGGDDAHEEAGAHVLPAPQVVGADVAEDKGGRHRHHELHQHHQNVVQLAKKKYRHRLETFQ